MLLNMKFRKWCQVIVFLFYTGKEKGSELGRNLDKFSEHDFDMLTVMMTSYGNTHLMQEHGW